ncbi:four helix bundle protein [Nitrospira sp. BLG_1]|uniref:four helix bundle protein n=1 Tax=Nitrospira sp. BLG_1 TaxID=3395883 RepID=UPI0039BC7276
MAPARTFQDLEVWKLGRSLRRKLYEVAKTLPAEEHYNFAGQIRAAAISLTANLAEGFGRFHYKENAQFCRIARGSACEVQDHLLTCLDEGYIPPTLHQELNRELTTFLRTLNAYIKAIGSPKAPPKTQ